MREEDASIRRIESSIGKELARQNNKLEEIREIGKSLVVQ